MTVKNNTGFDLQDVVYNIGSSYVKMDYLPAGESGSMTISMDEEQADQYDNLRNLFPYQDGGMFQSSVESEQIYSKWRMIRMVENEVNRVNGKLYAFLDQSFWRQRPLVNGEETLTKSLTLLSMEVPLEIEANAAFYLPYGVFYADDVVNDAGNSLLYSQQDLSFYASQAGYATAIFDLSGMMPQTAAVRWELYGYSSDVLEFSIYNVQSGQWDPLALEEEFPTEPYLTEDGRMEVRVAVDGHGTDVWMDGMRPTLMMKGGAGE